MSDTAAINEKIATIEAEMRKTQKNKATNYHLGTLKAKIAKLKSELINGPGGKSSGTQNAQRGFEVTKSGDTRIGLVGFPVSVSLYIMIPELVFETMNSWLGLIHSFSIFLIDRVWENQHYLQASQEQDRKQLLMNSQHLLAFQEP
jgi:hypothetical protein